MYFVLETEIRKRACSRHHQLSHVRDPCECVLHNEGQDPTEETQ